MESLDRRLSRLEQQQTATEERPLRTFGVSAASMSDVSWFAGFLGSIWVEFSRLDDGGWLESRFVGDSSPPETRVLDSLDELAEVVFTTSPHGEAVPEIVVRSQSADSGHVERNLSLSPLITARFFSLHAV